MRNLKQYQNHLTKTIHSRGKSLSGNQERSHSLNGNEKAIIEKLSAEIFELKTVIQQLQSQFQEK